MRVLLDTNIFVSGLMVEASPPGRLVSAWLDSDFELITSRAQIAELRRVLGYEKVRVRIVPDQAADVLVNLDVMSTIVEPVEGVEHSPDPDDNVILATAIAGDAMLIVSGDRRDMLALGEVRGIPIVNALEAVKRLFDEGAI